MFRCNEGDDSDGYRLKEMEFILSLTPSARVLHAYYIADAYKTNAAHPYDERPELGTYASDSILNDIDGLIEEKGGEGLMLDEVRAAVEEHLPEDLVDEQHLCLLHQYALNKPSGRSLRGTTKYYDRPTILEFYPPHKRNAYGRNGKMSEAHVSYTGYALKFVNLSPDPLVLWWDGIDRGRGERRARKVGTIAPFESIGTSGHPGHAFYLTPTYDKEHQLKRWTVTEDEPILYHDPLEGLSDDERSEEADRMVREKKWTAEQRFLRDAWIADRSFGRDYLVRTGRVWLAQFPTPSADAEDSGGGTGAMRMRPAPYLDHSEEVSTKELPFASLPEELPRLTGKDYAPEAEAGRVRDLAPYRSAGAAKKKDRTGASAAASAGEVDGDATTATLNLRVISVAPRVFESRRFLSPAEVNHLVALASGKRGDVVVTPSTVTESALGDAGKEESGGVRGREDPSRTSATGWVHREQDAVVDAIFRRVADLLGIDEDLMRDRDYDFGGEDEEEEERGGMPPPTHLRVVEAMQLLRYGPGDGYAPHHDFTYPSIGGRYQPRRYATVLLYLTGEGDVVAEDEDGNAIVRKAKKDEVGLTGGATTFPRAVTSDRHDGVQVPPRSGSAVTFYGALPDGNMDDLSQHSGDEVAGGVKYVANVWVWDPVVN
ncbi:hypothetical protein ACHAWF_017661 [Thalassiosira exigua]